jgi:recombinational DNA repair ATPase RecF
MIYRPCMNGFIEKIQVKNFKCHDFLEFQLHPYVNFILGRNGSNDSSLLSIKINLYLFSFNI